MENLKTVSALVKNILEHDHKARNTDNHLYLMVLEHYSGLRGIDIHAMTVPVFLKELDRRSFPGFETVRRSRQKVQATYPDLAPSEAVGKRRAKNIENLQKARCKKNDLVDHGYLYWAAIEVR